MFLTIFQFFLPNSVASTLSLWEIKISFDPGVFFQLLCIFKEKLGQIQYQLSTYQKMYIFLMHKIEWDELWQKVVECYFKKLLLDNLFHKHFSSIHVENLFFYFLILYFNMFFFFHLIFFEPVPFKFF